MKLKCVADNHGIVLIKQGNQVISIKPIEWESFRAELDKAKTDAEESERPVAELKKKRR